MIDGSSKTITANLEEVLRQLRPGWSDREIWVEALCINQKDKEERASHVSRMESI